MADKDSKDTNKDVVQQPEQKQEVKKLYPKSFRITDEVYKIFKDISKSFSNQDETLKQLCQCYELNSNSSNLTPSMQSDIKKFNDFISGIQRLFISSLEYTNIVKDSEQEKYKIELDLKDKTIVDLKDTINTLKSNNESLDQQMKELNQSYNQLKTDLVQQQEELNKVTDDFQSRLNDKDQVIASLSKTNQELENECASLRAKANSYDDLQEKYNILSQDFDKYKIQSDRKLVDVKAEYNKRYDDLNSKHSKEINALIEKFENHLLPKQDEKEQKSIPNKTTNKSNRKTPNTKRDNKS